jgi:hypothetical protein
MPLSKNTTWTVSGMVGIRSEFDPPSLSPQVRHADHLVEVGFSGTEDAHDIGARVFFSVIDAEGADYVVTTEPEDNLRLRTNPSSGSIYVLTAESKRAIVRKAAKDARFRVDVAISGQALAIELSLPVR